MPTKDEPEPALPPVKNFNTLVAQQGKRCTYINNAVENTRKLGQDNINIHVLDTRVSRVDQYWQEYDEANDILEAEYKEHFPQHRYFANDMWSSTEDAWIKQRSQLLAWKDKLVAPATGDVKTEPASAMRSHHSALTKISVPQFNGQYTDWPAFRDLFRSLVHNEKSLTDAERLHYLVTSLKGEAEDLTRSLISSGDSYPRAWERLTKRYENPRVLVRANYDAYDSVVKMKNSTVEEYRRVMRGVLATIDSMEAIGRPVTSNGDYFVHRSIGLFEEDTKREWERKFRASHEPPTLTDLVDFLEEHLNTLVMLQSPASSSSQTKGTKHSPRDNKSTSKHVHHASARPETRVSCPSCSQQHPLRLCSAFLAKSAVDRYKFVFSKHLCLNCFGPHILKACDSKRTCFVCGKRHHTTLHDSPNVQQGESEPQQITQTVQCSATGKKATLLAMARVLVRDRYGNFCPSRALLDPGADTSLISEALVVQLRLSRRRSPIRIVTVSGKTISRGEVSLSIAPRWGGEAIEVTALILPTLPTHAGPGQPVMFPHLRDLTFADPDFWSNDPYQILLGVRDCSAALRDGVRRGAPSEPIAQETIFGWIVSGAAEGTSASNTVRVCHHTTDDQLTELVKNFWRQEELPPVKSLLTREEQQCEDHFVSTHSRQPDGRYVVRLPVREPLPDLADSFRVATTRLRGMERRFSKDTVLRTQYDEFLREYVALGHMSAVESSDLSSRRVAYLPHHGVLKQSGDSMKLRVVFNGSAVINSGITLNQQLLVGANLLPPLTDILMKWRSHRYVFATDMEKMYRQVVVAAEDRDLQRILWRQHSSQQVTEYRLNTVTYGLACAPFLAMRVVRQLASDESQRFPAGSKILLGGVYVDDILAGAATLNETEHLITQITGICTAGGLPLRKWASNSSHLLRNIPTAHQQDGSRSWEIRDSHSTLGLSWNPSLDQFSFSVNVDDGNGITKRSVLSQTARLFDPLGWLAPVVVRAKILIQRLWIRGLGWDDPLPEREALEWEQFKRELPCLRDISVKRWLGTDPLITDQELHGFADASEMAYAAVVYLRTVSASGQITTVILTGKSRVAPLKRVSIPRLELCAAHLLVKLVHHLRTMDCFMRLPVHLWSDSTVTLSWILGHPAKWQTFVANRVAAIQETLPDAVWHHAPGKDNPADCASRGLSPAEIQGHPLWWEGPSWLQNQTSPWPVVDLNPLDELPETRVVRLACTKMGEDNHPLLIRFSSLRRLLRVTAWCLRWRRTLVDGIRSVSGPVLTNAEVDDARYHWILVVQRSAYKTEIDAASRNVGLERKSPIFRLSPFLDERGLLRVGGRLRHSILPVEQRHPIILPTSSPLTRLIVIACHEDTLHGGVQATLTYVRQRYWIPKGRTAVKTCIHRCVRCVRWRAAPMEQRMADLPARRVVPSRPFLHTGVDYAGPYQIRLSSGRGCKSRKAFISVFVCFSSRAVHLEVVSDYSADAFLAALRRFVSRRGLPSDIYSDQGTTFIGADSKLRALFAAADKEGRRVLEGVERLRINWHFNPPASPHFGGLWEAAVKSVKHHLRRVIGDATLTFEEMTTLLAQIEACLNSRPLRALTDDPDDPTALTPGHLLIGAPLTSIPEPSLLDESPRRLLRWSIVQHMRDQFWKRWGEEYLTSMHHRPKWWTADTGLRVGRLCILRSELTSPGKWPLARIIALHPGEDNLIRVVTVKTATNELRRPVVKLVLLPDEDELRATCP